MENLLPWITGSGGALVVLALVAWAFYAGRIHADREFSKLETENDQLRAENGQLRAALDTERKTVNETASAGQVTNQLITALAALAAEKTSGGPEAPARPARPGLTAKDMKL